MRGQTNHCGGEAAAASMAAHLSHFGIIIVINNFIIVTNLIIIKTIVIIVIITTFTVEMDGIPPLLTNPHGIIIRIVEIR